LFFLGQVFLPTVQQFCVVVIVAKAEGAKEREAEKKESVLTKTKVRGGPT